MTKGAPERTQSEGSQGTDTVRRGGMDVRPQRGGHSVKRKEMISDSKGIKEFQGDKT